MTTPLQEARDRRRFGSCDPIVFEFVTAGIICFIFSLIVLYLLPNDTPPLAAAPILFFGIIMLIISTIALLYVGYVKFSEWVVKKMLERMK